MNIRGRLTRLEERASLSDPNRARIEEDAAIVGERIQRLVDGFAARDGLVTAATKAGWSPAQRVAWTMRFASNQGGAAA